MSGVRHVVQGGNRSWIGRMADGGKSRLLKVVH